MDDDLNFLVEPDSTDELALDESSDFDMTPEQTTAADDAPVVQTVIPYDNASINLGKDKFAALMSVFQMLKPSCQDLYIKNGLVTQTNNKKSMIFRVDLTNVLGTASILISSLAGKYELLIPFRKQNVDVYLDIDARGFVFRDAQTKIHHGRMIEALSGNNVVYMSDAQVTERSGIDPNRRILSYTWPKKMLDRIITYAKVLGTPVVKVDFNGDSVDFKLQSLDNASTTQITLMTLEDEVDDTSLRDKFISFPIQSLVNFIQGGVVEIKSEMYVRMEQSRPAVTVIFSADIPIAGTNDVVNAKTYVAGFITENTTEVRIG